MGNDPTAPLFAEKHIRDAAELTKSTKQRLEEEAVENRKAYERFYNSLALFSSGTIALSITYLGYLKSIPNRVVMCPKTLIASWLILLVCLIASLFYTFFNAHYMHFARVKEYMEKLIDQKETQAREIDNLAVVNLTTPAEKQLMKERFLTQAKDYGENREWAQKRENIYTALWIWSGRVSRFSFPLGIGLLTFFAIKNM